jgi:hypothetical protein
MKIFSTIFYFLISNILYGQVTKHSLRTIPYEEQNKQWLDKIENPEYESFKLGKDNLVKEFLQFDFSTLLIPRCNFLGFLDTNYQRIKIYFTSVDKRIDNPSIYEVKGISIVNDNKCNFVGTLKINQIRKFNNKEYSTDHRLKDDGINAEGILIGEYLFTEDSTQIHSGIFKV